MICSKCKTPGIKNQALNKEFYYCRTCKEEIIDEYSNADNEMMSLFQDMHWGDCDNYLDLIFKDN